MVQRKNISSEEVKMDRVLITGKHKGKEFRFFVPKPAARELSIAEQQELTKRVMSTLKKSQTEKLRLSGLMTTVRDVVTCTDSFLIRAAAYAAVAVLLLCIAGGVFVVVSSLTSGAFAKAGVDFSFARSSNWDVSKNVVGKISYLRSKENYIISNS